jgi:hypothetical protein
VLSELYELGIEQGAERGGWTTNDHLNHDHCQAEVRYAIHAEVQRRVAAARKDMGDLLEQAWGIIANAGAGDWGNEKAEWQRAAKEWRGRWHAILPTLTRSAP